TRLTSADTAGRPCCDQCNFIQYQNSKPCIGAIVVREGKVLLAQRRDEPFKGYWDTPGGFLEPGEHPEQGVIREIKEETGLDIRPTYLIGMYIDTYGEDGDYTLNIYYLAEIVGGELRPASDVTTLAWFSPEDLPTDLAFGHEYQLLRDWLALIR
ncbi:MAG: hypothetical protein A2Z04_06870, partial [Chloroflexi bacterium RBG_16_57_9]